jgi:hypothetical protein
MTAVVAALVNTIFAALALLHVYWAAGGRWGAAGAVPEVRYARALEPGPAITVTVALLLAAASCLIALRGGLLRWAGVPSWVPEAGTWVVGATMAGRAVGDFRLSASSSACAVLGSPTSTARSTPRCAWR